MKTLLAILLSCIISATLPAQERFVITDFGAVQDASQNQTEAIQRTIDAAARRGGTVVIPRGEWLSGPLYFKPKTHLYLEKGAVLKAGEISIRRCNGFSISGKGRIEGHISIRNSRSVTISECDIASEGNLIDLKGCHKGLVIENCTLRCVRHRNILGIADPFKVKGVVFRNNRIRWIFNKDEEKVEPYTLPDPLLFADGFPVASPLQWPFRRQEILDIFQQEMYGSMPPAPPVFLESSGDGSRRHVRMTFREDGSGPHIDWDIAYPAKDGPVPAVLLLNFIGNEMVMSGDPGPNTATVFPIDEILARGYAFVTAYYKDISPDPDDLQDKDEQLALARTGMYELWAPDCTTGSIMAWAWGLCRGMDLIERDARIDASKVVLTGSSRLGKAALVAAAFDQRFAVMVINQTGGGGVPLSKRNFGEFIGSEVDHFGYWWCRGFAKYAGREKDMPFDQHMLISCLAPRPLLVEGFNNPWFDTRGEFLALQAASPVWQFLGAEGLPEVDWPENEDTSAIGPILGYVRRDGGHGIAAIDWKWMLDFADKNL